MKSPQKNSFSLCQDPDRSSSPTYCRHEHVALVVLEIVLNPVDTLLEIRLIVRKLSPSGGGEKSGTYHRKLVIFREAQPTLDFVCARPAVAVGCNQQGPVRTPPWGPHASFSLAVCLSLILTVKTGLLPRGAVLGWGDAAVDDLSGTGGVGLTGLAGATTAFVRTTGTAV